MLQALLVAVLLQPAQIAKYDRFQIDDLDRIVQLSDPQLTPDGKAVAVVVSRVDVAGNRYVREIALVQVSDGKDKVLVAPRPGVGQPRWSPKGDRLAFLAGVAMGKGVKSQVFLIGKEGGEAKQLTKSPTGVQHFTWSPDGSQIAFAAADEPAKRAQYDDVFEIGNDSVFLTAAPTSSHVWLVNVEDGASKRLTSGSWSLPVVQPPGSPSAPLSWRADGKMIAFVRQATPHFGDNPDAHVAIIDLDGGGILPLTIRTKGEGYPMFAPIGNQIAYSYPKDGDSNNLKEWCATTHGKGPGKSITAPLDRNLTWCVWGPGAKHFIVGGNDGNRVSLWKQPLDGKAERFDLGAVIPAGSYWLDVSVGASGDIAFVGTESHRPGELYVLDSGKPRRLTKFNDKIAAMKYGKVETITWKSDAFEPNGILYYPPGFDSSKKYPLVLWIHGGPTNTSTEAFSTTPQILASQGNIVFSPNYRGSDNQGNAFQRAIFNDAGAGPGRDVMAGLDAVKKLGHVDEARIAVTGWSYGGFMTTWLIGNYQGWRTAIAGAAVTDLMDQYNLSDTNVSRKMRFGGSPWTGDYEKDYRAQSPIHYVRNVKTPTLILSTTGDARVPITQSFRYFHALRDNGVQTKFLAWPVGGHYPADPYRRKDVMKQMLTWLAETMPETPTSVAPNDPAASLDQKVIAAVGKGSQILQNVTHLSDVIGPRLTGTPALKSANDWTLGKMKEYGLQNVHLEPWTIPEGWTRGHATGRIIEPNNGRSLSLASAAWAPGTPGKVQTDVVILNAKTVGDLRNYVGKLKGKAILLGEPAKLKPILDVEKIDTGVTQSGWPVEKQSYEEIAAFRKALKEFLTKEEAAALLQDANKHLGLLFTTGSWGESERPSADAKLPSLYVAHEHYALLHRLASRPEPTRIELDVVNHFVPGPITCFNTVGEIVGKDKPDEFVVVGAHLDSWDLGQGALDNAGGSCVVLDTARALMQAGVKPSRTIRFVLFTGEEQGLHGSKAYVKTHKDELDRISACLVHDSGTGRVNGLGWHGRKELLPILEKEMGSLRSLGVQNFLGRGVAGSDHYSFDKAGVPGCIFKQEVAGYRFGHHSQADTLELVREADLVQGAQVMAVTALRLANMPALLPRK